MFGSGLPVLAVDFPALAELLQDDYNGRVFRTADELSDLLSDLLFRDPLCVELQRLRKGACEVGSWGEHWAETMQPMLISLLDRYGTV